MPRVLSIIAVVLLGCTTSPGVSPPSAPSTELELSVEAEPLTISWSESVRIRLTVKNPSDAPVVKGFSSGCIYGFSLLSADGEVVAPPPRTCTMNAPTVTYAPNSLEELEFQWTWDDKDIKPGTYRLVAGFGPRGEGGPSIEIRLK